MNGEILVLLFIECSAHCTRAFFILLLDKATQGSDPGYYNRKACMT